MKIIVDAFGGDNAPLEIIKGSAMAVKEFNIDIVLCGNEEKIRHIMKENNISDEHIEIAHADSVIDMEDDANAVVKTKTDSSMAVGYRLLKENRGDAFVSAGNSGAVLVGASLIIRRIKGIKRAALAPLLPNLNGCSMLIDCGANVECKPEYLVQFAVMGSIYMNKMLKIENPRIALANNGTEEHKGTSLQIEAHKLLSETENINFTGNIEGRNIPLGACDVIVADGFTGNIILKTIEGMGLAFIKIMKDMFTSRASGMLSALLVKNKLREMKHKLDYTEYGGAPLMGISKPVIKAHGSSNAKAFKNAIRQAVEYTKSDVIGKITSELNTVNIEN